MATKYFSFAVIEAALKRLHNYHSKWVLIPLVFAANGANDVKSVQLDSPGTDSFLKGLFSGNQIDLTNLTDLREVILRPIFLELTPKGPNDLICTTTQNLWGNGFSSRGYRDMRQLGLITGSGGNVQLTLAFWTEMARNLTGFQFEDMLTFIYAFRGIDDSISSWSKLSDAFWFEYSMSGGPNPKFVASGLGVSGLPWPTGFSVIRPSDSQFCDHLIPSRRVAPTAVHAGVDELITAIETELNEQGLKAPNSDFVSQVAVSLILGKHIIFQGLPGTGKTSLAVAVSQAAESVGLCKGYTISTGSSDWTPSDTVGAYRLQQDGSLKFSHGFVTAAAISGNWLIIDEINRADIDKAFGSFFTLLSGQATTLRFTEEHVDGRMLPVSLVPQDQESSANTVAYSVSNNWRIIGTMNTRDLDLLFELSQAFLRRFALIQVDVPSDEVHSQIVTSIGVKDFIYQQVLSRVVELSRGQYGPAVSLDCAKYIRMRETLEIMPTVERVVSEIYEMFLRPQVLLNQSRSEDEILKFLLGHSIASEILDDDSDAEA